MQKPMFLTTSKGYINLSLVAHIAPISALKLLAIKVFGAEVGVALAKNTQLAFVNMRGFNFPAHRNLRVSEGVENLLG